MLASLQRMADPRIRDDMGPRYGIHTDKALGVQMAAMQKLARSHRVADPARNHALAAALWETGWYEARTVAVYLDEPALLTPAQMDRWAGDFDNWGICDTVCFHLFDKTPHAFGRVRKWSRSREEFVKRAAFALLASLALHDKQADDDEFAACLPLIEKAAVDERNFVKKGVSWALRACGRRGPRLRAAARELAERLAESQASSARWVGKDALRDLKR